MGDRATAIRFYNQAVSSANDKSNSTNIQTAYQLFVSSAYTDPTYWQSHYQCGNNNSDLVKYPAAIACWRRALECELKDDEKGRVLANLAQRLHTIGKIDEALPLALEAARLLPNEQGPQIVLSLIYGTMRRPKDALKHAERAFEINPSSDEVRMNLSFALLFDGQLARGFDMFECRYAYTLHSFTQYPYPKWNGERGITLMLVADQGMGDTLSFARFIPEVARRCGFVHLAAQAELMRAFQHAFKDFKNIDVIPLHPNFRQADYWSTMVSLPYALKLTDEEIRSTSHIDFPRTDTVDFRSINGTTWKVPDRKFHIGIQWTGSNLNLINAMRSIPVETFLELCRVPGIQLYSLQIGERSKDLHDSGCAAAIKDLSPYIRDVVDTVAFLPHLDLVICCESALGHICATADKECWIPYSYLGRDYRLGHRGENMMWTPKTRVFLQEEGETWESVFMRIVKRLRERVDGIG